MVETKAKRLEIEEKQESKKQKSMKEELEWIRSNPKARQAKSKARIKNYEERLKESKEKELRQMNCSFLQGKDLEMLLSMLKGLVSLLGIKISTRT